MAGKIICAIGWAILIIGWVLIYKSAKLRANNDDKLIVYGKEVKAADLNKFGGILCLISFFAFIFNLLFAL